MDFRWDGMGSAVGGPLEHPVGLLACWPVWLGTCNWNLERCRLHKWCDPNRTGSPNLGLVQYYLGRTWGLRGEEGGVCGFGFCLLADASLTVTTVGSNFGHLPTTDLCTCPPPICPPT